jgi:hypothetical protein
MFVEAEGETEAGEASTCSWHLVAEADTGPAIPAMAAAAIIIKCLQGNPPATGARPACRELELPDFEIFFSQKDIRTGYRRGRRDGGWPVFHEVLDSAWSELPAEIRDLHDVRDTRRFQGRAKVSRGESLIAKLIGRIVGFPPAGTDVAVEVSMRKTNGREYWQRNFSGHKFSSVLSPGKGRFDKLIKEQFGPVSIVMALVVDGDRLNYVPRAWTFIGLPMPNALIPRGQMCEYVADGKFHFHVEINLPIIGHIVTYEGFLEP